MSQSNEMSAAPRESAPRFAGGWAALFYTIAAMTLAYPALGGSFAAHPRSDQYIAGFGFREFAVQSLKAGEGFPQWDAFLYGGMPYIAAMHGDIFYPTFLLRLLLPTDVGMTWGFIIHLILAGWLTYAFLRAMRLSFHGSLVGGLAYMMSGPIAAYVSPGHDGKLFVSTMLPLACWMLLLWMRDGRPWAIGAVAVTVGLGVLSPHPQLLQYLLLASGSFALYLALTGPLPRPQAFKRLGAALGAVGLGMAIGAIQYLPVMTYTAWSPRGAGGASTGWEHATSYSMPIEETLNAFIPQFSGILDNYWGRNGIHFHSEYVGVAVLILAGLGMTAALFPRRLRWFWIGTMIVSLIWAFGGNTPFYRLVYELVPGTPYFRAPSTMMYVTMFSLAVLSAFGAERVLAQSETISKRVFIGWAGAAVLLALITIGSAMPLAESIAAQKSASFAARGFPADQAAAIGARVTELARENADDLVRGALRSLAFVAVTLVILWAAYARLRPARHIAVALLAVILVDLWTVERRYWNFSKPAREAFATDPAIDAIKASGEAGRVVTFDAAQLIRGVQQATQRDPIYRGSALMAHHVRTTTGYHGNELDRYQKVLEAGSRFPEILDGLKEEFWRHENVRWLYTTLPESLTTMFQTQLGYSGPFTKVLGPVKNASGSNVWLYRVPGDNPPAVVATAFVKGTDEAALATVLDPRFDARRAAIVDTSERIQAATLTAAPEPSGVQPKVTRFESGAINVELSAPVQTAGSMLVVSENFYPGWRATVGGQSVEPVRANYNLIGVPLPAGARDVQLRFVDKSYETGKLVTIIAVLAAIAAIVAGVVIERRRPGTTPVAA